MLKDPYVVLALDVAIIMGVVTAFLLCKLFREKNVSSTHQNGSDQVGPDSLVARDFSKEDKVEILKIFQESGRALAH
jgi:hypothetical protein